MNSAAQVGPKKPTLCRYFVQSGTCFYGTECQFLHSSPPSNDPSIDFDLTSEAVETILGQQFDLVFHPSTLPEQNGLPQESKLSSYINRPLGSLVKEKPCSTLSTSTSNEFMRHDFSEKLSVFPHHSPSLSNQLTNNFTSLTIDSLSTKMAPNPAASEFVPRSSTPSTGSYLNYGAQSLMDTTSNHCRFSQGHSLSASASPLASPRLSPNHSPLMQRRNLSPVTMDDFASTSHSTYQHVDGTTYYNFYPADAQSAPENARVIMPNFNEYSCTPAHLAHMKPKANAPSFFMPDELRMEILNRRSLIMAQVEPDQIPADIPREVDAYHNLCPLEPLPSSPLEKTSTFSYVTSVYKATNVKSGLSYCLRRIHGFRLTNIKCMTLVDMWKKLQHSNIVQLREVFTTKTFGDNSIVFVHDYHPGAETMMFRHFNQISPTLNGINSSILHPSDGIAQGQNKSGLGSSEPRQHAGLLPESLIWCYVVQLSSALRTIHATGLAYRTLNPKNIIITSKSRLWLNWCGIYDVLTFDPNQANPLALMSHYQQEDLISLGKIVIALACNSLRCMQRDQIQSSMELVTRNYSPDLRNLIVYLLTQRNRARSVNDIMPMIGARFYTQLDAAQLRSDVIENELAKEVENGRLFRLLSKLGIISERPELNLDTAWSETGDRYLLKLFRDYLFHQVTDEGRPWIDMAHVVQCLNKLDAGVPEKICLTSRDEQNVLVVSYAELKHCFESSFNEVLQAGTTKVT